LEIQILILFIKKTNKFYSVTMLLTLGIIKTVHRNLIHPTQPPKSNSKTDRPKVSDSWPQVSGSNNRD